MSGKRIVRSTRVLVDGAERAATVHIAGERIVRIDGYDSVEAGVPLDDHGSLVVMPGLVDSHVHINDPGRAEWEGFATATRAAAAGGVTTLVDMPLNSLPPTTTVAGIERKREAAEQNVWVDVAFSGGLLPSNSLELAPLREHGAVAFKCFLVESGVEEFPHVLEDDLRRALPLLAETGAPLLVHAEVSGPIDAALKAQHNLSPAELRKYIYYLESRPKAAENQAIEMVIRLVREFGVRAHIVHLSSADALLSIRDARDAGVAISAETCPHYLTFTAEAIADGATEFKCAPPIRERENRERLWRGLRDEIVTQIVTDHSPSTPALKCCESGDFSKAWGGIASLQLGLVAVWSQARERGAGLTDIVRWMCETPAKLVGLWGTKGALAAGFDADITVFDPDAVQVIAGPKLEHRHKLTPYHERSVSGKVCATYLRGRPIYNGTLQGVPSGRVLSNA